MRSWWRSEIARDEIRSSALHLVIPDAWPEHDEQQQQPDHVGFEQSKSGSQYRCGYAQDIEVYDVEEEGHTPKHLERPQQRRRALTHNRREDCQSQEDAREGPAEKRKIGRILGEHPEVETGDETASRPTTNPRSTIAVHGITG